MAFWGRMRRAINEAGLWLAVTGAAIFSFYFFEDTYRVLELGWPKLQASIDRQGAHHAADLDITRSIPKDTGPAAAAPVLKPDELRSTDTGMASLVDRTTRPKRRVTLTANDYGHFVVQAEINGISVDLLTDTGATYVALNYETALQIGLSSELLRFTGRSSTANGVARVAPVNLDYLRVGSIVLHDVEAVVAEPGKMPQNLLGMSFIKRLSGFQLSGNLLNIVQN